jgi:hypothetical protein
VVRAGHRGGPVRNSYAEERHIREGEKKDLDRDMLSNSDVTQLRVYPCRTQSQKIVEPLKSGNVTNLVNRSVFGLL